MGKYINTIDGIPLPAKGKAEAIAQLVPGTYKIEEPTEWEEDIVCVVNNQIFDAAGYAYDPGELDAFKYPTPRQRTWLHVPNAKLYAK